MFVDQMLAALEPKQDRIAVKGTDRAPLLKSVGEEYRQRDSFFSYLVEKTVLQVVLDFHLECLFSL